MSALFQAVVSLWYNEGSEDTMERCVDESKKEDIVLC